MAAIQRLKRGVTRVDSLSPTERSEIMARVRSKNSRPELFVRKLVFAPGYRYRLHAKDLPGHPDIVFRKLRIRRTTCYAASGSPGRRVFSADRFSLNRKVSERMPDND